MRGGVYSDFIGCLSFHVLFMRCVVKVRAVVDRVQSLDARPAEAGKPSRTPPTFVSLEGFSCMLSEGVLAPAAGSEIEGIVTVRWPKEKGKRPLHFLTSWQPSL